MYINACNNNKKETISWKRTKEFMVGFGRKKGKGEIMYYITISKKKWSKINKQIFSMLDVIQVFPADNFWCFLWYALSSLPNLIINFHKSLRWFFVLFLLSSLIILYQILFDFFLYSYCYKTMTFDRPKWHHDNFLVVQHFKAILFRLFVLRSNTGLLFTLKLETKVPYHKYLSCPMILVITAFYF